MALSRFLTDLLCQPRISIRGDLQQERANAQAGLENDRSALADLSQRHGAPIDLPRAEKLHLLTAPAQKSGSRIPGYGDRLLPAAQPLPLRHSNKNASTRHR